MGISDINAEIKKLRNQIKSIQKRVNTLEAAKKILAGDPEKKYKRKRKPNSLGTLTIGILKEANKSLHVKEIQSLLIEKGKDVVLKTITCTCVLKVQEGTFIKTAPNTFEYIGEKEE